MLRLMLRLLLLFPFGPELIRIEVVSRWLWQLRKLTIVHRIPNHFTVQPLYIKLQQLHTTNHITIPNCLVMLNPHQGQIQILFHVIQILTLCYLLCLAIYHRLHLPIPVWYMTWNVLAVLAHLQSDYLHQHLIVAAQWTALLLQQYWDAIFR